MKKALILLTVLTISLLPARAEKIKETVKYAEKDGKELFFDRHYDPATLKEGKTPTMIYMFGGGWAYGGRGGNYSYLTDIGVQVISIDYRLGLTKYGYNPSPLEDFNNAIQMALDDLTDAMAYVLEHAEEMNVDTEKIMLSGSSAGGITTLMSIYDICNGGKYSKKFPEGWMPAGYIGYAGGIIVPEDELVWAKKPCPMMFFHGSADTSVAFESKFSEGRNVFGPKYILNQLHEMGVPNYLYTEIDGDHVLSYKAFSGYNFKEIQTFVEKFVIKGLQLEMVTTEYNLEEASHLPDFPAISHRK